MTKAKVGDYVVYSYKGTEETTPRLVTEVTDEVVRFEEYYNESEREFVTGYAHDAYRIVKSAPASTEDLIANLVRRVYSLEKQLRDVQGNIERQGVEIAELEHATKTNCDTAIVENFNVYYNLSGEETSIDVSFQGKPSMSAMAKALTKILNGGDAR